MKNEHRKIASKLQLFNLSEHSSGMVYWYPKGYYIFNKIESYIRQVQKKYNYLEVKSPVVANSSLWKKSGHIAKFKENMFIFENDDAEFALKPMNCPFHIEIFEQLVQSYNDLPLRLSEFGLCHRNEASGSLNGLLRLRSFHQDDGHIFCKKEDIFNELSSFIDMLFEIYKQFGFKKESINIKLSLRPEKRIGSDSLWDEAESYLKDCLDHKNINYLIVDGEGAFYGPKIEFSLKDSLDREWQCGTFQLDFMLAEKMNVSYIDKNNRKQFPIILHRAALGSLERFIAILLEHYDGKLPIWLNPNAIQIIPVSEKHLDYCHRIKNKFNSIGFEANINLSNESMSKRIKQSYNLNPNSVIVIGDRECNADNFKFKMNNQEFDLSIEDIDLRLL